MNVNAVEAVWLAINLFSAGATLSNLVDAYESWRALAGTSRAWHIQARANLRREAVQFIVILGLLIVVLPALVAPGDTPFTFLLAVFMMVPLGLALNGYLDRRTRRTLERLVMVEP